MNLYITWTNITTNYLGGTVCLLDEKIQAGIICEVYSSSQKQHLLFIPLLIYYLLCFVLGEVDGIYYGGNHFASMTDSGTATLKPRPRVRPLLTFLPLVSIYYTLHAVRWYPSIHFSLKISV